MIHGCQRVAAVVTTVLMLSGLLAPLAHAQAPYSTPEQLRAEQMKAAVAAEHETGYEVGANVANVFYVPGKAILCGIGTLAGVGVMLITFGSGYRAAAGVAREGCGGRWRLSPDDLRPERPVPDGG
jgi:hypothetical protein